MFLAKTHLTHAHWVIPALSSAVFVVAAVFGVVVMQHFGTAEDGTEFIYRRGVLRLAVGRRCY
jgi:hypothetical protein